MLPEWWEQQIKGIPNSEELCTRICDAESRLVYAIVKDRYGSYKLYTIDNYKASYTRHKADSPLKLEKFINYGGSND